jgi:hypothetical protein
MRLANPDQQMIGSGRDSSPFDSSPFGNASPRAFWQRGASPARFSSENWLDRSDSTASMSKRPSIEKLKQASRVKNSSMFAREQKNEYDPTSVPVVERPLAGNRPLSHVGGNAYGGRGIEGQRQENPNNYNKGHRRGQSSTQIPVMNPTSPDAPVTNKSEKSPSPSPSRNPASPTKSSLSTRPTHNTFPRNFDPNTSIWSDDDDTETRIIPSRPLRRQAKSVTFDTKPPEINEYEMVTPDPSVASVASGSREGSYDDFDDDSEIDLGCGPNEDEDSFDASLEDTDKTPVVLPEDWRHMSPEVAHNTLANQFDDPFNGKDGRSTPSQQWNAYRHASVDSEGEGRPLPALPPYLQETPQVQPPMSITDRVAAAHGRTLPTPPHGSGLGDSTMAGLQRPSMSLEDRLRLMGLQDNSTSPKDSAAKEAARLRKHGLGIHVHEEEVAADEDFGHSPDYELPRISRESILRKVHSRTFDKEDRMSTFSEEHSYGDLDPDVPIPSREASSNFDEVVLPEPDMPIKQEEIDEPIDVYSIPEYYSMNDDDDFNREGSVIRHEISEGEVADDTSCYSLEMAQTGAQQGSNSATDDEGPPTPKQEPVIRTSTPRIGSDGSASGNLPELSLLDDGDFQSGLATYLSGSSTPPPPPEKDDVNTLAKAIPKLDMQSVQDFMRREVSHEHDDQPDTPESVVHRPVSPESVEEEIESPAVPEPVATIKASGSRLKTRISATPADLNTMAAVRRKVSGADGPPPIPEKSPKRLSMSLEPPEVQSEPEHTSLAVPEVPINRRQSFRGIDICMDDSFGEDISFGLDREFDRVIESSKVHLFPLTSLAEFPPSAQPSPDGRQHDNEQYFSYISQLQTPADLTPRSKKGYLMRQNTKVVVAKRNFSNESDAMPMSPTLEQRPSSAGTRSAGSSPRKPSHDRSKSWTTEPWNGKPRRKSIRSLSASKRAAASGPVPPLPGQESAVSAGLDTVVEGQAMIGESDADEGIERGRLFVKVCGVKDLDLPMSKSKSFGYLYFRLALTAYRRAILLPAYS